MAWNNRGVFSYSRPKFWNQHHWAKIKLSTGLCSLWRQRERIHALPFPASGGCEHSLASSGWTGCPLWLSHSSLCLHGCVDFSSFVCQIFFCPYLIRIHMIACTVHLDSIRKCPHLKILSIITSAKSIFFFAKWSNINSLRHGYLFFGVGAYFSAYHSNLDFSRVSWCFHWGRS